MTTECLWTVHPQELAAVAMVVLMVSRGLNHCGAVHARRGPIYPGLENGLLRLERHPMDLRFVSTPFPILRDVDDSVDLSPQDPNVDVADQNTNSKGLATTEEADEQGGDGSANLATEDPCTGHEDLNVKNGRSPCRQILPMPPTRDQKNKLKRAQL
jgi:hypothetical protein